MKPIPPARPNVTPRRLHVDLLVYPDSMLGLTLAMVDLLRLANTLAQLQGGPKAQPVTWQLLDAQAKPLSSADPLLGPYCCRRPVPAAGDASVMRACFVAPLFAPSVPTLRAAVRRLAGLRAHLDQCLQRGDTVVGLSNGLWLFAGAPGMQGRAVAVAWYYVASISLDFPALDLQSESDCVEDGPVVTGGTMSALPQVVVSLLRRALGPEFMQAYESLLLHAGERHAMALQATRQSHIRPTRDSVMARAMQWLDDHLEDTYSLAAAAQAAAVSPRTLLRHFQQVMGCTPLDYLHSQRCKRARIMLEVTLDSVATIARACGYSDTAAFRRVFLRYEKTSPAAYRSSHALRASRLRWQVEDVRGML